MGQPSRLSLSQKSYPASGLIFTLRGILFSAWLLLAFSSGGLPFNPSSPLVVGMTNDQDDRRKGSFLKGTFYVSLLLPSDA